MRAVPVWVEVGADDLGELPAGVKHTEFFGVRAKPAPAIIARMDRRTRFAALVPSDADQETDR